ncbi:MAG: hypothetical protein HQ510_10275 [Candidatus Marinimicrobia bacterium]|nr:hypothetical protein [Candidatus Neomarinimicrobiota bacterium]
MNIEHANPFNDPKLWIAIIAVLIALFNFAHMTWFKTDQNKKWRAINEPYIKITNMFWVGWLEIDRDKAKELDWGYSPYLISHLEGKVHQNKMRLYDKLVLWDDKGNIKIEEGGSELTVSECMRKAKDLNLAESSFSLRKHKQLHFDIENIGNTLTKVEKVEVYALIPVDSSPQQIFSSISEIDLPKGEKGGINIDFFIPIKTNWEEQIFFTVKVNYLDIEDKMIKSINEIIYTPSNDTWSHG